MRTHTFVAVLLIASAGSGAPAARGFSLPDEMLALAESVPASWRGEPVVVMADSTWIELHVDERDGNRVRKVDVTWYFVNHTSPARLRCVHVLDHEAIEAEPAVSLRAYGANGAGQAAARRDIERVRAFETSTVMLARKPQPTDEEHMATRPPLAVPW